MTKNIALTKIESHEKLCRIMQKQTHDKIKSIEKQIDRIETILNSNLKEAYHYATKFESNNPSFEMKINVNRELD